MRKTKILSVVALAAATALAMTACSGSTPKASEEASSGPTTIVIGATPTPHGVILKYIQDNLATDAGLNLEIKPYNDYVIPNRALSEGDLDANYFQHVPYFDAQVKELGYKLAHYEGVHIEPMGVYSKKVKDLKELKEGAKVGVTNDPSNQERGLDLLVEAGLITLKDTGDKAATVLDVDQNNKRLQFVEMDAAQLPRSLEDLDAAVINGNFALEAGLKPASDALLLEKGEGNPYANIVAVREEDKDKPALKKLDELMHSPQVAEFIKTQWPDGEVIPAF